MALGRWCEKCDTSWSVRKHPKLRKCPKCGEPFRDVWRIEVCFRRRRVARLFHGALGEAREFEQRIKKSLRLGEPLPGEEVKSPLLKYFVEKEYLPWLKENRPASYRSEASFWRLHLLPLLGSKPLDQISPLDGERAKKAVRDKGLSPRMEEKAVQFLKKCLNQAYRWKKLPVDWRNPMQEVKAPKFDNRRKRAITPEEWRKLAPILQRRNSEVYGVGLFSILLGLRRGEILAIRWEDIDLERKLVRLPHEKDPEGRVLPLPTPLLKYLHTLPQGEPGKKLFKVHKDTVTRVFREAVKEAGLNEGVSDPRNRLVFHSLRHGFTTALVEMGVSTAKTSRLTRHKDLKMLKRYEHLNPEALRPELEKLSNLFASEETEKNRTEVIALSN